MLLKKIAALWGLLVLSCALAKPTLFDSWPTALSLCILSLLLITAFRLWDDLADRDFDRQHSTERIIVQSNPAQLNPFYWLGGLLFLLSALLLYLFAGIRAITGLAVLAGFMAAIYYCLPALTRMKKLTPRRACKSSTYTVSTQRPMRTTLVLLKYPAMLILLTEGQLNLRTGLFAFGLYGLLLAYECFEYLTKPHDNTT